jgi:hypothetical protein
MAAPRIWQRLAFCAVLAGLTSLTHAQVIGLQFESVNAQAQGSAYHVLKVRYTGTEPMHGNLVLRAMHCRLEPPQKITEKDPQLRRSAEALSRVNEASTGQRVFGATLVDIPKIVPGAWFVWHVARVPRAVTSCDLKVFACGRARGSIGKCTEGEEALTITSASEPPPKKGKRSVQTDEPVHVESTTYRMRDTREGEIFVQLHEIANRGPFNIRVQRADMKIEGCSVKPVSLATSSVLEDSLVQLDPGERIYSLSAVAIDSATSAACRAPTVFLQTWEGDSVRESLRNAEIPAPVSYDLLGTSLTYSEIPADIEYE